MRTRTYLIILSIMASLIVTSDLQAGPLNRASELETKVVEPQNSELKRIRLARQVNAGSRKSSSEVRENTEHHSDKKRSKKRDRKHQNGNSHHRSQYTDPHNKGSHKNKHRKNKHLKNKHQKSHKNYARHDDHHQNRHSRKFQHGWRNQYWGQKYNHNTRSVLDWQYAGEFQTRRREKISDIHIEVNGYIDIVELEGLGRGTVIYKAYIETQDGRLKRLRNLEGYVERGDYLQHALGHQKYVRALHLEVASSGSKRAYAKVKVGRYHH